MCSIYMSIVTFLFHECRRCTTCISSLPSVHPRSEIFRQAAYRYFTCSTDPLEASEIFRDRPAEENLCQRVFNKLKMWFNILHFMKTLRFSYNIILFFLRINMHLVRVGLSK